MLNDRDRIPRRSQLATWTQDLNTAVPGNTHAPSAGFGKGIEVGVGVGGGGGEKSLYMDGHVLDKHVQGRDWHVQSVNV